MDKTKRNQQKIYNNVDVDTQRSNFPMGYKNRMTLNFNKLIPTMKKLGMPGDAWHYKTIFFSRWLQMVAPAFVDYEIKFNNFFIAYTQVWAGFQQFLGEGDDQAAQYLLSPSTQRADMRVPYTSSKTVALMGWNRILEGMNAGTLAKNGLGVGLTKFGRKFFRLVAVPVLCWKTTPSKVNKNNIVASPLDYTELLTLDKAIPVMPMLAPIDSYTDELISKGCVYDLDANNGYETLYNWYTSFSYSYVGVYSQFNYDDDASKTAIGEMTVFEIPQDFIPLPECMLSIQNSEGQYYYYVNTLQYGNSLANGWFDPIYMTAEIGSTRVHPAYDTSNKYLPCGYLRHISQSETSASSVEYEMQDLYYRCIGEYIVRKVLGVGTLTDYFGKVYEHQLLRQPFDVASYLLQSGSLVDPYDSNTSPLDPAPYSIKSRKLLKGTYSETSPKISVGVVNDEPISLLDYLCYKKAWSDYFRDPRYELRDVYADPYHSPFMQPFQDGTYLQGFFGYNLTQDGVFEVLGCATFGTDYDDDWEEIERDLICNTNPFTLSSFIDFFNIKERRCVQDFFTLMTPQSQFGDDVVVDAAISSSGSFVMSPNPSGDYANVRQLNSGGLYQQGGSSLRYDKGLTSSISIKALRLATRIQKFMERSNFVGSDYVKQILAHYGVNVDHCQHCRAEYLGGDGGFRATVSPVEMVGASNDNQTTGQQSANAYASGKTSEYHVRINEFGCLLQLISVQNVFATTTGQERDCIDKYDFPFPEFANLGSQAVPLSRICMTDGSKLPSIYEQVDTNPQLTFGYQPRYAQFKCSLDEVHGDFRKSLAYWVSTREFNPSLFNGSFGLGNPTNVPELGKRFLYENADYGAFVNESEDYSHVLMDIEQYITCSRLLPVLPSPNVL